MTRALLVGLALGFGLALVSMPGAARAAAPGGEYPLMLRLNGSPVMIGHLAAGADAGTVARVDGGTGEVVKVQCYAACCVCAGLSCSCGNAAGANVGLSTTGEAVAANGVTYLVLNSQPIVSISYQTGSLLLDGGAGAEGDVWLMK